MDIEPDGHGPHVCGIIAGSTVGVAPEAELMVASVIESETARTSFMRVVYGLNWLLQEFTADATGVAALYLCREPTLSAQALRAKLLANASSVQTGRRSAKIARYL
ncbi:S8 family serine peptidase [Methylobacterium sp. ID0610]|uniref:S8 family serine peptidase n=1 Tax=Methylobacterium carpenticola TaxID=3344827 RepID=UPI00369B98AD